IGDSLRAKQWLGFRPWGRTKRPVPRPKIVMFRLEDVPERFLQVVVVYVGGEPEFEFVRQGTGGKPVGGEGEPALRMVGRAESVEAPQFPRQDEIGELLPFTPPVIPNAA